MHKSSKCGIYLCTLFFFTNSDLEARSVYVSTREHIEAHFLICFVALTLARILELKTEQTYRVGKLLGSLSQANCVHVNENLYLFSYYDEVLKLIGEKTEIKFDHKMLSLGEIKKI